MNHLKTFIIWTAFACLLTIAPLNSCWAQNDPPEAYVPETTYKFDKVIEGTEILHAFKVQNRGKEVLQITKVKTS